ncbi:DUF1850 domain-containing protein [Jiella sp. MQZ9-1]|uniref:DUF1850 domain-containing protein n=1 Tax=Jiella flava TaxID=2816857 RepID=A0A939G0C6_9HYPH|nr:DUF1850 domain-containing protein [Jiella flava]MBO0663505.1 DUF1850 domain-containing protein [Jiella flava]MCD2472080.1 DUF1850 domain-containing protein [Jiella flava]
MICILTAGKTIAIAASAFTLAWTHSVEKTRWEEHWRAGPEGLTVIEGRIEGSGAGMEPPENSRLLDGAYVYELHRTPIPELVLAASGGTVSGWTFCAKGRPCRNLGQTQTAPIHIRWCAAPAAYSVTKTP